MSGYKRVNFYELCRLCAQSIQDEKTHIFQDNNGKAQLQNKIKLCLSLNVTEDDFLPKVVCSKCTVRLEACNTFREECLNSESMLSSYFKNFRQTEDFKKSGKVYIKDTKSTLPIPEAVSSTTLAVASLPVAPPSTVNLKSNLDGQFYTVQLPALVPNPHLVNSPPKLVRSEKVSKVTNIQTTQQQLAYNINLLNATLKNSVQQIPKELLSNVLVNANGEVIKITPPQELENSILNARKVKKVEKTSKKLIKEPTHNSNIDENIVKIDLTEDNTETSEDKKLPHIKSTNQVFNTKVYQNTLQQFNANQNLCTTSQVQNTKYQNTQNFTSTTSQITMSKYQTSQNNILQNAQTLNSVPNNNQNVTTQDVNSLNQNLTNSTQIQTSKYISNQNPTVILPISDFQSNFTPYPYTQSNVTNNNVTNVISEVDSTINSQDLQPSNTSYPAQNFVSVSNVIQTSQPNTDDDPLQISEHHIVNPNVPQPATVTNNVTVNSQSQTESQPQIIKTESVGDLKLHECELCHKRFKRREHLYQHIKLHTGFRPYKCNTCQKSFMRKEHMLRHMTLHSGIRKFECELCGKCFSRNDNLLKHKKTHNKQSSYTCEVCKKTFVMKHYYTQHMQKGCFVMGDSGSGNDWKKT